MIALWLALAGCGGDGPAAAVDVGPADLTDAMCAVCGMVVAEQPAPRGQAVYRDGTHLHTCSLGDLRALVQAPSPRGAPVAVYVEDLGPSFDPAANDTAERAWVSVEAAWFVFGAERPLVMGLPVLSYGDEAAARAAAVELGAAPARWEALVATPFNAAP